MGLPLANVQATDTFQTWLTRTNQIIETAANNTPINLNVTESLTANTAAITNSLSVGKFIDLTANTTTIPHAEGRVYYDGVNKSVSLYTDETEVVFQLGLQNYIRARNNTGSPISKGVPVYISGSFNGIPTIAPADATSASTLYAIGLAAHTIEDNSTGFVVTNGLIQNVNTLGILAGATVHVAPGGGFQETAPQYPNYAHEVGIVTKSSATEGAIFVVIAEHYLEQLRVENDTRIGGDLTVEGNFNVLGTEVVTTLTNLQVADTFVYLNAGDSLTANSTGVTGLNDLTFKGHYEGTNNYIYAVKIDSTGGGGPDRFSWSLDNFSTTEAANVAITSGLQTLRYGISVRFLANTGHSANDTWTASAAPINVDVGIVGNRNTGNTGVGYTHVGVFFDVSDTTFKFFEAYRPEVEGNVNTGDASFALAKVQANNFIGDGSQLTALNASEITTGTLSANRLATSGVIANTYGSASQVPVITVDNKGRITELTTTNVAGVTNFVYTNANTTLTISTADGGSFKAKIADNTINAKVANTVTLIATNSTDATHYIAFVDSATGDENIRTDTGLTYNPSSGILDAVDFNSTSDERLKKNVKPIENALDKVMQLAGVEFDWKENDRHSIGLIAQQVEAIVPEVVDTKEDGYKSISYGKLTGVLIEAIKELKALVDNK